MLQQLAASLKELEKGDIAVIKSINEKIGGLQRRRLLDLGIVPGAEIRYVYDGPIGTTRAYEMYGTIVALREEQYEQIIVTPKEELDV
jgi:Fe2+ transport system protein FeoA